VADGSVAAQEAPKQRKRETLFKPAAPPPLDLPKSGGSLRGLGEKFKAGSATGTGAMQVPVPLSPCRNGAEPKLVLSYDSGHGHGAFGIGWMVGGASITRRTDKGMPRYADAQNSDTFILSGQEDLVPALSDESGSWSHASSMDGVYRVDQYAPRIEGLFARIERRTHTITGDAHWRSINADNVTSIYGLSPAARIADPSNPLRIFKWLLEVTCDAFGNVTFYEYKAEDLTGVAIGDVAEQTRFQSPPANCYPKFIHYGNRTPLATRNPTYADITALSFMFEVVFDYGEHSTDLPAEVSPWALRQDPFSSYRSGFEIRTYRLCQRILMFHTIPEQLTAAARLVHATELGYDAKSTITYLTTVRGVGYAWDDTNTVTTAYTPTLRLDYTRVGALSTQVNVVDPQSLLHAPSGIDGQTYQFIDLDGEGIAGILTAAAAPAPALLYKRNLGGGTFAAGETLPSQPSFPSVGSDVQLMSLNADGRLDVTRLSGPTPGFFERTRSFDWSPFQTFMALPNIDFTARGVHFLDIDGDGLTDILVAQDDVFVWYPSQSRAGYGPARRVTQAHDEDRGAVVLTTDDYETIFLADMSGDGLSDLVRIRNGSICYWPNLGYGRFGARIIMQSAPLFDTPDLFDPRHVRLGDIDGTGVTDVVYLSRQGAAIYFNEAGNGFAVGITVPLPLLDSLASVRVADFLGTGTSCLVWSSPAPAAATTALRYIDLLQSTKPHLLNSVINGAGAQTAITYAPSTTFYLEDRLAGHPWATRLPFVIQTVQQVTTTDAIARTSFTMRYRYAHGFYDGIEREFRGFARVDAWDAVAMSSDHGAGPAPPEITTQNGQYDLPPIHTISWYHTGAWNGERDDLRATLGGEFWAGDAQAAPMPANIVRSDLLPPALREAYRAMKGHPLRQEVYAEDGSAAAASPYSVTEFYYEIREIQPIGSNLYGVYHPFEREQRVSHYERNAADPRIMQKLTLAVDALGHVQREAHIALARRIPAEPEQAVVIATAGKKTYAPPVASLYDFLHGVPAEIFEYEFALPASSTALTLSAADTAMTGATVLPFDATAAPGTLRLIEHLQHQYWDDALSAPLPIGMVETRPLIYDHVAFAFPATQLAQVFGGLVTVGELTATNGYVSPDGDLWTHAGVTRYDAATFYHPVSYTDPFGNVASVIYDALALFIIEEHTSAVAAFDNITTAAYDYRVLLPKLVTDPNGNRNAVAFDPLGMVVATAVMGVAGAGEGDTIADPTTRIEYDLLAWEAPSPGPIYVHTLVRQQHGPANPGWFESYSYFDGAGEEVLRKTQAEADVNNTPRWSGSGRKVFDNKGNEIKRYEPYFVALPDYDDEDSLVLIGYSAILSYDPLSRLIRTDFPDGTFASTIWDSWSEIHADADDTVLDSVWYQAAMALPPSNPLTRAATLAATCANTPATHVNDALGRVFLSIADNGAAGQFPTRIRLDIQNNALATTDPLGNVTLTQIFDAQGNAQQHESADAGITRSIIDGVGRPYRAFDPRGYAQLKLYDELHRLTQVWVTPPGETKFLAEILVYGETLALSNFRGRIYQHFDGAGVLTNATYDFENRITQSTRQLAASYTAAPAWDALAAISTAAAFLPAATNANLLELDVFTTLTSYDAMSRIINLTTPDQTVVVPSYDAGSLLASMTAFMQGGTTATPIVVDVDYNAQGQRVAINYGSGIGVAYTYDDRTHLVTRVLTTRATDGVKLQDLNYVYDPAHNIVQITDQTQQAVYFSGSVTTGTQLYEYDPLYRITKASGREQAGQTGFALGANGYPEAALYTIPHRNDLAALLAYQETYAYDNAGNIQSIIHQAGGSGWTRRQTYVAGCNRLDRLSMPGDPSAGPYSGVHAYDLAGNTTQMPNLALLVWDHDGRLASADLQGGGTIYFTYDSTGQRIRKLIVRTNQILDRVYIGNYERYRECTGTALATAKITLERDTVHIFDGHRRFAMADTSTIDTSVANLVPTTLFRLQFPNHLGSACLETDLTGAIISYEEYYPFGGSSYRAGDINKRYRYSGKERDEETGLYYHGARYYAPWLARWISPDPMGLSAGENPYVFVSNNPIRYADPTGLYEWPSLKTMAVVAAVVVVGTVVTVATAGAAAPLIGAAVASAGLTGAAATVATGVAVGAVAGAAGGVASEVARTGVSEGRLPNREELKSAAVSGAIGGAVTGGLGAAATAVRGGAAATRAAATVTRAQRATRAVASAVKAGVEGGVAGAAAEAGKERLLEGHVDLNRVATAGLHGAVGGVVGQAAAKLGPVRGALGAVQRGGARAGLGAVRATASGLRTVSPRLRPLAASITTGANRGMASIEVPAGIQRAKQSSHIEGTPNNLSRVKGGKTTSIFIVPAHEADALTVTAWNRGTLTNSGSRVFDFGKPIGVPNQNWSGGYQTKVEVHMDSEAMIHGHPSGRSYAGPMPYRP
jgi:RHS repeat-associated protein